MAYLFGSSENQAPTNGLLGSMAHIDKPYDGVIAIRQFFRNNAITTLANDTTTQNLLGANGVLNLLPETLYEFEVFAQISRTAGTTSRTITFIAGGTSTLTGIAFDAYATSSTGNVLTAPSAIFGSQTGGSLPTAGTVVTAASTSATENNIIRIKGTIRSGLVGGTFIPQVMFSAAPGGTAVVAIGAMASLYPLVKSASSETTSLSL